MTYLLDTHVWLWMLSQPERLGDDALSLVRDRQSRLLLSAASSWEIAIKHSIGRLDLPEDPETYVPDRMVATGVQGLPVQHSHALRVATLPRHHNDPFDRLLIAQALLEAAPVITADPSFELYEGVEVVRAGR